VGVSEWWAARWTRRAVIGCGLLVCLGGAVVFLRAGEWWAAVWCGLAGAWCGLAGVWWDLSLRWRELSDQWRALYESTLR